MSSYFLIISLRRCGSSYLMAEIDRFEGVYCCWEHVLRNKQYLQKHHIQIHENNFSFIESIGKLAGIEEFKGSKVTIMDFQYDKISTVTKCAEKDWIKIIHIIRPIHEQMISLKHAQYTGVWQIPGKNSNFPVELKDNKGYLNSSKILEPKLRCLSLDPEEVRTFCESISIIDSEIAKLRMTNPYYCVEYGKLSEKIGDILKFIGAKKGDEFPSKVKAQGFGKVINVDHKTLVNNWSQVSPIFEHWGKKREEWLLH